MAVDQQVTTYSDTAAHKRVISDAIFLANPMDIPVVARFGLDSANQKFRIDMNAKSYKVELLEDTHEPLSTTANQGTTITTSTLSITVTDGTLFQPGMEILIDAEYMVVNTVNATTNVITVFSRSYGGTNATHATGATINIVGMARLEGDDADYVGLTSLSNPYNYTSIFQKALNISGSEQALSQYGKPSGEMVYQENKALPERMRLLERMFFHGVRAAGSATTPRAMGGVGTFVTSNSSSITTTITKAAVDAVSKAIYDDGFMPDVFIIGTGGAATLHGLLDSSSFVRIDQENTIFGMRPIVRLNTQFSENLAMLVSRHCPATKAYMLDGSKVGFYQYRPFQSYDIAKVGDSIKRELVGEFSLLVANGGLAHGFVTTTAASL